jgi:DNA-binding PadR family transcriptional regulator
LILAILTEGENYGYVIIRRVRELSGGELDWKDGMLYPVLHRMEGQRLIRSEWRVIESGRRRKYYRITPAGRKSLASEREQWMRVHKTLKKAWEAKPCLT